MLHMHQQQPHQELSIPRERVTGESRGWQNMASGKQLHSAHPPRDRDRNEKWNQRDVGAFRERNVPENLGHSFWHCPFHQIYGLCHEQAHSCFACINMHYLREKDRKRRKTDTPSIGISNMTSLHLCPWIFLKSMHQGPQAHSTLWYAFLSPWRAQQIFGESTEGFTTRLQLLKHTAKSFVLMSQHRPSAPWKDITLVAHSHKIPSTNPKRGPSSFPTHTWTSLEVLLTLFSDILHPIPLFFAKNNKS